MLIYNKAFFLLVAIFFNVVTVGIIMGILENKERIKKSIMKGKLREKNGLAYFPKFCSSKGIICYVATLALVSAIYFSYVLPFQFILFGLVPVIVFFNYSNKLSMSWWKYNPSHFAKHVFTTSLIIRIVYVVFIYFYYIAETGVPHMYFASDEWLYHTVALSWRDHGYDAFKDQMDTYIELSDSGYIWWLAIEYRLLGTNPLPARIVKCFIDSFSCLLIYSLARRNFGERVARIAALFYMLMPNMWYYCGITLKETEMAFLVILFVERGDLAMRATQIKLKDLLVPLVTIVLMFTFRTALAAVLAASLGAAIIFSSKKQLQTWKKVLLVGAFAGWMFMTIGVELFQETKMMYQGKMDNQESGYLWRTEREGGNSLARYATASAFAPLIFTIPFPTLVHIPYQQNQMMMNGGNMIKNIMSVFVILSMFLLLFRREWRQHTLPLFVMLGYLMVLVFSTFAHSERFHFPVLGLELMFAAFGVSQMTNRYKRLYVIWLVIICIANIGWAWVKLKGRGWA